MATRASAAGSLSQDRQKRARPCRGGSRQVPGDLLLTAEAALRAGAGKVQIATIASVSMSIGIAMPEAGVIALPETAKGDVAGVAGLEAAVSACDVVIAGPAMGGHDGVGSLVDQLINLHDTRRPFILDAGALMDLPTRARALRARACPAILTPHLGEMAAMLDCEADAVDADREAAARRAADIFGAVVVLKASSTLIATPDGSIFLYEGGGPGLATAGSGDVLAGLAAGFAARGASTLPAALWSAWMHGEAGRYCARDQGPLGFLARELPAQIPAIMASLASAPPIT